MASFIKRIGKNGAVTWQAKIRRKGYPALSETFCRRADAEQWAKAEDLSMDRGRFIDMRAADELLLEMAIERYRREITPHKKGKKQEGHRLNLWRESRFAKRPMTKIVPSELADWRDQRITAGASPNTVRNDLIVLSHVFTVVAREWGYENLVNPVVKIKKPKMPRGRERRLHVGAGKKPSEETALLEAADKIRPWIGPMIIMALETTMRLSEILRINRDDTDFKKRSTILRDTKNGTTRNVPLSRRAMNILKELPVFDKKSPRFFPFEVPEVEYAWKRTRAAAGCEDLHFHDLRHEAISRLFEKGLDDIQVGTISGHKDINMLRRYAHLRTIDLAKMLD